MEDDARIGLYGCMVIAAIIGVLISAEQRRRPHVAAGMGTRLLLLLIAAGVATSEADTIRGFIIMLAAPVGAYKIARTLADPLAARFLSPLATL